MGVLLNLFGSSKRVLTPLSVPGCALWLDATNGVYDSSNNPITTNNTPVARWEDLSGNSNNFTQTTLINQPLLKTNSQNGLNGVFFNQNILSGTTGCNLENKNLYIAIVHNFTLANQTGFFETILSRTGGYSAFTAGGFQLRRWDMTFAGGVPNTYTFKYDVNGNYEISSPNFNNTNTIYTLVTVPRSSGRTPYNATIDINDSNLVTLNVNDDLSSYNTVHKLSLGAAHDGPAYNTLTSTYFYGTIYEVIIYQRANPLTTKEISGLSRYIRNKWGI